MSQTDKPTINYDSTETTLEVSLTPVLQVGEPVGDYIIQRVLGKGAFAIVYLAREVRLDRDVALKVTPDAGGEARTLAALEHDHIVKVYSETVERGRRLRLLAMQRIPGSSLDRVMKALPTASDDTAGGQIFLDVVDMETGEVPLFNPADLQFRQKLYELDYTDTILWMGARLADALAHAHSKGILHLDVKPANVIFSVYGRPMLTDFNVSLDRRALQAGAVDNIGGTVDYMAPEHHRIFQLDPEEITAAIASLDGRADVYSLGVVLTELLTEGHQKGHGVYDDEAFPDSASAEIGREHTAEVLKRALEVNPDKRYASAEEMKMALEGCLELRRTLREMPPTRNWGIFAGKHPLIALSIAGAIPQVVAVMVGVFYNGTRVVNALNPIQVALFEYLNITVNPILGAMGGLLWLKQMIYLWRRLAHPKLDAAHVEESRRAALKLPVLGVLIASIGWIPSAFLYPYALNTPQAPLTYHLFGHLMVSFGMSWLIAMTYSYLFHQYLTLRFLYPRAALGTVDIRAAARREVSAVNRWLRLTPLTVVVPLMGAVLLDFASPTTDDGFRRLMAALIALGLCGTFVALRIRHEIDRVLFALTGADTAAKRKKR